MIIVVCGEDIAQAREAYIKKIALYRSKGMRIQEIQLADIEHISKQGVAPTDLFGTQTVYTITSLSIGYKGRKITLLKTAITDVAKNIAITVIDWEGEKGAYELASFKKIITEWIEIKPAASIFQLLEQCYPGNLKPFLHTLGEVSITQEDMFIFTLLWRHIRKLIGAQSGIFDAKTAPWQRGKLSAQAKLWTENTLLGFYKGLIRIDANMKSSDKVFDVRQSLELLACLFL